MASERAINMALRVVGIGEVERDFRRVGQAGSDAFERVDRSANGADRRVSEYTERLRRVVQIAKNAFDTTPGVDTARLSDPSGYLAARNQVVLQAVELEKKRMAAGLPDLTQGFDGLGASVEGAGLSLARVTAIGAAAGLAFIALKEGVIASAEAFMEHERALDSFEATLALNGNLSRATADDIHAMAEAVRDATLQTEESALQAAASLASVPGLTESGLQSALDASARLADALNQDVAEVVEGTVRPALQALADHDMKALYKATEDLNPSLVRLVVQMADAGKTAEAQTALIDGLRDAAGDGPDGLTRATDRLTDAWSRMKQGLGEDIAGPAATMLNTIADGLDWIREKADAAGLSWRGLAANVAAGIPVIGPALSLLVRAGGGQAEQARAPGGITSALASLRQTAASQQGVADRKWLQDRFADPDKPKRSSGGGRSDAEREAERLQREADRAREAAGRVAEANDNVVDSYRRRAEEAEGRLGLEGAALEVYERKLEVEATIRRLNREEIDKEVEARRALAAQQGASFDEAAATSAATAAVEAKSGALREYAERLADANQANDEFTRRQQQAAAILEQTRTPIEALDAELDKAIASLRSGDITAETFDRRLDQLAERFARVAYQSDEAAQAWRGFGNDVGRTLSDIALNGGDARDILQELIRLPLERLLFQNVESPIAGWIDSLTGNNPDANSAAARAGMPTSAQVLGASVSIAPPADGAAAALGSVQATATGAAQALASVSSTLGNPIVDLTGETQRATDAMASLNPVASQLGGTLAQVIAGLAGGGGGGGLGGLLQVGLGLAGAAIGGGGSLSRLVPDVSANIAAHPELFASGTPGVPTGRWFEVGENGRELMRYWGGNRLEVMSEPRARRFVDDRGSSPILHQTINIPERADPRRTLTTVNRGTQLALARATKKGIAA